MCNNKISYRKYAKSALREREEVRESEKEIEQRMTSKMKYFKFT